MKLMSDFKSVIIIENMVTITLEVFNIKNFNVVSIGNSKEMFNRVIL